MTLEFTLLGAEELQAKLTGPLLDAPLRAAVRAFGETADKGSGMGARANSISRAEADGGMIARISTTLNWPRTVGTAWEETNVAMGRAKERPVMDKTASDIEEDFDR